MTSIREWAEGWIEIPSGWEVRDDALSLSFESDGPRLSFSSAQLKRWRGRELPSHAAIRLVPHCGIELDGFAEYLVDLEHLGQWPRENPLSFRVGDSLVRLGAVSAALSLLLEPHYQLKRAYQFEFYETLSSIQVRSSSAPREDAQAAIFYLNADYLRPSKASARIHHLISPNDFDKDFLPDGPLASRKRVRRRSRIDTIVPVQLYIAASSLFGEARFLGFYRVLEFFFGRARLAELSAARRDPSVSDSALIKRIRDERGELPQLQSVVRSALTTAEKRMLVRFVTHHKLAECKRIDDASAALYQFRNAIVHAKEEEVSRSRVPDPFSPVDETERWQWVAEFLAGKCIRRLGSA